MNSNSIPSPSRRARGSALITTLIFILIMVLVVDSILRWSMTERRMNVRTAYWIEAHNAAEGLCEYAFEQIANNYNGSSASAASFTFKPGVNPLAGPTWPGTTNSFFTPNGDTKETLVDTNALSATDPNGWEVVAGQPYIVENNGTYYQDNYDLNNLNDPILNQNQEVLRWDVPVMAKATVVPADGTMPVTVYVTETLSLRGQSPFSNAVFYSKNDMELSPGGDFQVWGPVKVNGNIFLSAQGTVETGTANYVNFHGPISIQGDFYHAWQNINFAADGRGYSDPSNQSNLNGEPLGNDPIQIANASGTLVNLINTSGGNPTWHDSTMGSDSSLYTSDSSGGTGSGVYNAATIAQVTGGKTLLMPITYNTDGSMKDPTNGILDSIAYTDYQPASTGGVGAFPSWVGNNLGATSILATEQEPYNPIGFDQPIDSSGDLPDPHQIIAPPITIPVASSSPYYSAYQQVANAQYSNKSNLYVQVTIQEGANGAADIPTIAIYGAPNPANVGVSGYGPNGGSPLTLPSGTPGSSVAQAPWLKFVPYQATETGTTTGTGTKITYSTTHSGTKYYYTTTTNSGTLTYTTNRAYNGLSYSDTNTSPTFSGSPISTTTSGTTYSSSSAALAAAPGGGATAYAWTGTPTPSLSASTGVVTSGMYDQHQSAGIDLVQFDAKALAAAVNDAINKTNTDQLAILNGSNIWGQNTAIAPANNGWNGAVYVQVSNVDTNGNPITNGQSSVIMIDGKTSSSTSSLIPTVTSTTANLPQGLNGTISNPTAGLTVVTNAPMYILGSYNSDGTITTNNTTGGSATTPDDGNTDAPGTTVSAEVPCALGADAVTILSPNFFGNNAAPPSTTGGNSSAYGAYKSLSAPEYGPSSTGSVDIAAALITGLTPTSNTTYSGGLNNLPRFLEDWQDTVAIRGSMVSLYSSTIATAGWAQRYYSAPNRVWGFDAIFQNGALPPQTPLSASFRRMCFQTVSAATYTTDRLAGWPGLSFIAVQ